MARNIIGIEWGGNSGGVGDSGHPHDITVKNIHCGKLTFGGSFPSFGFIVWISSAFNVTVDNISAQEAYGIVSVYSGDKGSEFAPAKYRNVVGSGITVNGGVCPAVYGS